MPQNDWVQKSKGIYTRLVELSSILCQFSDQKWIEIGQAYLSPNIGGAVTEPSVLQAIESWVNCQTKKKKGGKGGPSGRVQITEIAKIDMIIDIKYNQTEVRNQMTVLFRIKFSTHAAIPSPFFTKFVCSPWWSK